MKSKTRLEVEALENNTTYLFIRIIIIVNPGITR